MGEETDIKELREAGLYNPGAPGADERLALLRFNIELGVSVDEMIEAPEEGLALLGGRRVNLGSERQLSLREVAERTGESTDLLVRIWRAAGFAEPDPGEEIFTESSLELLELFKTASQIYGEDVTLQLARVVGSSVARIADAEVTAFVHNIAMPLAEARDELAIAKAHVQLASLNPALARALDLVHRYHCEAALRRIALVPGTETEGPQLAVGFADLVGFTALSQALPTPDLATAITTFESRARDTVTGEGGRVVKLIGDEVMFVADTAEGGCEIALRLVEEFRGDDLLPPVRGGLASGETIRQEGDYFGPIVNLAARATKMARPGSVLVPEQLTKEFGDTQRFTFRRVGPRRLKGFGEPITLYSLRRPTDGSVA
jgi:adenylate cyclase